MTIRVALGALIVTAALATSAVAAPQWNGAGWYIVLDTPVGAMLGTGGPFASKDACEQNLPRDTEEIGYSCAYLSAQPEWDD